MSQSVDRRILKIDASGRYAGSQSRMLTDQLANELMTKGSVSEVIARDLAGGVEFVDEAWIGANSTPQAERTSMQQQRLEKSDELLGELFNADLLIIGSPIYNFSIPAVLKAWIDQVARVGETFRYADTGPVGLLADKPVYLVITSGGTTVDSELDFATGYLRHVLGFIGLTDISVIAADASMSRGEQALEGARQQIDQLLDSHVRAAVV